MEGLNEKGFAILLGPFLALGIALIIVASLLALCICFGSLYCCMRYCISEDYEETQVVPISVVEKPTDSINQKWNSIYNLNSILSTMYQLLNNASMHDQIVVIRLCDYKVSFFSSVLNGSLYRWRLFVYFTLPSNWIVNKFLKPNMIEGNCKQTIATSKDWTIKLN